MSGEAAFTLRLDDPAGNSYVEAGPGGIDGDGLLSLERYERTREQARRLPVSVLRLSCMRTSCGAAFTLAASRKSCAPKSASAQHACLSHGRAVWKPTEEPLRFMH